MASGVETYDKNLVRCSINRSRKDKFFCSRVGSSHSHSGKNSVVYTDGIEEILNLKKDHGEPVKDSFADQGTQTCSPAHVSSPALAVTDGAKDCGEELAGHKVKVWLPKSETCSDDDMDSHWHVGKKHKGQSFDLMTHSVSPILSKDQRMPKLEDGIAPVDSRESTIPGDGLITVNGYKVKTTTAPMLEAIFGKYGDIAARCIYKSASVRASLLEVLCNVVQRLQYHDFEAIFSDLEVIENEVSDVEASKIEVCWLHKHLVELRKIAAFREKSFELKNTKATSGLITKAATDELKQRHAELLLAQERFKEAEKLVDAMRLVSRKIDDDIVESESEEYFWRRRIDDLL